MTRNQSNCDAFQKLDASKIRNACIIAHVDHGKTCLADCLISSNGLISARMAGKLRYMDNREDEQIRGITMKASAVTLIYNDNIINLIDSPGHVDFSDEVSSVLLLSDIAFLVIDVVEGLCSQTEFLLRQAIQLNLEIILVFNKIDRLAVEIKQTPAKAFAHIRCLLEQVNSCISQIISGVLVEQEDWHSVERAEKGLYFSPENENVIFASALHGYGFCLSDFVRIWSKKISIPEKDILSKLFTDSYFSKGMIKEGAECLGKKTLFEQFILQPLWDVHKSGLMDEDLQKLKTFADKMNVKIRSRRPIEAFDEFMRGWLPLTTACFRAAVFSSPSCQSFAHPCRLASLSVSENHPLFEAVKACDSLAATVVFVAKILQYGESILAMCRILSGSVRKEDQLFLINNNHSNGTMLERPLVTISGVYLLMGREKIAVNRVVAGVVCAIEFSSEILATTLCSEAVSEGLVRVTHGAKPLVRVSVQPEGGLDELRSLRTALKQLSILDSNIRVIEQENGELAMFAAGEVHLQKCLTDLYDMGQRNIKVSEPSVPFFETIISIPGISSSSMQPIECNIRSGLAKIKLRAAALPRELINILEKNENILRDLRQGKFTPGVENLHKILLDNCANWLKDLKGSFWSRQRTEQLRHFINRIWTFGPPRARFNILFNATDDYDRPSIWEKSTSKLRYFDQSIITGFDLAVGAGPLCEEPMWGTAIIVDEWTVKEVDDPTVAGALISGMKQACREAQKRHPLRLMAAMYKCIVQTNTQALGKVHTVLSQRRAKILNEDMNQASGLFVVEAHLPVIESFSFCEQLRKKTSGLSSGQLEFSHWEIIDEDPFWEPTTADEVELYGVKGDAINRARVYMDAVRKRKGLLTDELIVINAEKQRTLKRNR
ncbi:Elongation factor Tu GTP binding domain family protein [Acanthocheilonema viteae]